MYAGASDEQLGATIAQDGKPLAFYARKLTGAQKKWAAQEREMLSAMEGLKACEAVLKGQATDAFTGHLPLLHGTKRSPRAARWKCLLEERSPRACRAPGAKSGAADAMPRLPMEQDGYEEEAKEWERGKSCILHTDSGELRSW